MLMDFIPLMGTSVPFQRNRDSCPATPAGIIRLFEEYQIDPAGKEVVVVGRSNIGETHCGYAYQSKCNGNSMPFKNKNLTEHTRRADILIVAIGKAQFITADMVREGAVVIDVGMNRLPDGKLVEMSILKKSLKSKLFITPVPEEWDSHRSKVFFDEHHSSSRGERKRTP